MPHGSQHPPAEVVREELERILASAGFVRNQRLSRFLRFVVERHLAGRDDELKESVVGVEVLGRRPDFDPRFDSTVRSEAIRLRSRLVEYYAGVGRADAVRIGLPKGGYVPEFDWLLAGDSARAAESTRPKRSLSHVAKFVAVVAAVIVALAGVGWWWRSRSLAPITIAVLPLQNLSGNSSDDYLATGLTVELIHNLALIDGLAPRSQISSFAFKGPSLSLRDVGRQLQAEYVLEGSVLKSGTHLRLEVTLFRVRDEQPIWASQFDREIKDLIEVQDEIAIGIVNRLRLRIGKGRRRYEDTNVEAYDAYLRARALGVQLGFPTISESVDAFQAVIAKDRLFAPAWAALAEAHADRSQQFRFDQQAEVVEMRAAADKAIELDPLLPDAQEALGIALARQADWVNSENSFRRAIELDRRSSEPHRDFALRLLFPLGRIDEALREFRIAENLDPLGPELHYQTVYALLAAARFDEASRQCDKLPDGFWGKSECVGRVLLGQGKTADAIKVFETAIRQGVGPGSEIRGYLGYTYARVGRRADAEKLLATMPRINPFNVAVIFAGLGDKDRCFEALNLAATAGPYRIAWMLAFPEYAILRGDPRVTTLRKKVGLPG